MVLYPILVSADRNVLGKKLEFCNTILITDMPRMQLGPTGTMSGPQLTSLLLSKSFLQSDFEKIVTVSSMS